MIDIKKELEKAARNSVRLNIRGAAEKRVGATKFGGRPDVPANFEWGYYEGESPFTDEVKPRPLAFLAQFDLAEIARYDTDDLLPKTGVLSFFYELESMKWGFDPKDRGCARVYWFEDVNALSPAEFPDDLTENALGESYRFPEIGITARSERSYQCYGDFIVQREKMVQEWEQFEAAEESLGIYDENDPECSKLLGWANIIQGNMTRECELVARRGYYLGNDWKEVTPRDRQETEQWANRDWLLLFQLDSVNYYDFRLMFGDCGRIYFYIHRDDLAARNFDNVWLILQSG